VTRLSLSPARQVSPVPVAQPAGGPVAAPSFGSPANLPAWLDEEARELLAKIVANAPEQSRPLTQTFCGIATYGFAGKDAQRLREIYDRHYTAMLDFVGAVPFGTPAYRARRDALIAYDKRNCADAVIERALEAAHG
jgi:hypothetical protein